MDEPTSSPKQVGRKLTLSGVLKQLVADGMVSGQDARRALEFYQHRKDRDDAHPLKIIADRRLHRATPPNDILTLEALTMWLARKANLPYRRIDPLKIDVPAVTGLMTYAYAERFKIIPVEVDDTSVVIATAEPYEQEWVEELSRILKRKIECVVSNANDISRYLVEFYALSDSVRQAMGKSEGSSFSGAVNLEQLVELGRAGKLDANDRYVVNIVDWLLQYAFDQRASDIHLEPRRDMSDVRFRIDGVLHLVYQLPTVVMVPVLSRLKVLGRMDVAEKRRPQDGRIKTKTPSGNEVELRLSTLPTAFGEKLVMRIFDPEVTIRDFEDLGLSNYEIESWKEMVGRPHGIILVTGPTGSGKTTTLYSTLKQLAKPEVNVCTVENPIEMIEPRFNQVQVHQGIGLDFASGLRTLLRQDPDIIMIGEIRDLETAEMAIQASLTGHLVFSTLHTNDATSAIVRLMDIGVPHYLLRATLLGVLAQRLVRTLCPSCKRKGAIDEEIWLSIAGVNGVGKPEAIYQTVGCVECRQTGYLGRVGLYEMLKVSSTIREMLRPDLNVTTIREQAIKEGMNTLRMSGAIKVRQGLTTPDEIFRVVGATDEI